MKIECIRTLNGPNVYSYRPVLLMRFDLGNLFERESREFQSFNEKLLTLLPGIKDHHCSLGRPGGFLTRLEEGTYFGHVVEHVALELTALAGIGQSHGKTRHDSGSIYNVAIEFRAEHASTFLLKQAVKDFVPQEILNRPKQGFGVPIQDWINRQLRSRIRESLTEPRSQQRGYVEPGYINVLLNEHERGRRDHSDGLWALFMLELWHRQFIDQPANLTQTHQPTVTSALN